MFIIEFNQKDYPTRNNTVIDRQINTHYYKAILDEHYDKPKLTDNEVKDNFTLEYCSYDELVNKVNNNLSENPRKMYFDEELDCVIKEVYNKKLLKR